MTRESCSAIYLHPVRLGSAIICTRRVGDSAELPPRTPELPPRTPVSHAAAVAPIGASALLGRASWHHKLRLFSRSSTACYRGLQAQWPSPTERRRLPWARVTGKTRATSCCAFYSPGVVLLSIILLACCDIASGLSVGVLTSLFPLLLTRDSGFPQAEKSFGS